MSLTSVCCRMMEAILKDDIVTHLEKTGLIRKSQHGFMRGKSCATNLVSFLDKMTAALDEGEEADVVFLDFAKAFDKVPTRRLLKKLEAHGISGKVLKWITSWLTGRRQRVVLNGKFSSWADVLSGVPQGSVLGPRLFIIFINDLDMEVVGEVTISKFADNTKLAQTSVDTKGREELQSTLDNMVRWADRWGMQFNVAKCKVMHLGPKNVKHPYFMQGQQLEVTSEEKDLGVMTTDKLKPSSQCAKAARTAQTVLGQITRAFHFRDKEVLLGLYKQYVRPHLEFAVQAWSPWTEGDKDLLEAVQRRMVRMITGLKAESYSDKLKELGLTTLEERRHRADMALVNSVLSGRTNVEKESWFDMAASGPRNTRATADPLNVRVQHGRLEVRKNFFTVRVTDQWNKVPSQVKQMRTANSFKKAYAKHRSDMNTV